MKFYTVLNIDKSGQPVPTDDGAVYSFDTITSARTWNREHNENKGKILETRIGRVHIPLKTDAEDNIVEPWEKDYDNIDSDYWKRPIGFSGDEPTVGWVSTFGRKPGWPKGHKFGPAA